MGFPSDVAAVFVKSVLVFTYFAVSKIKKRFAGMNQKFRDFLMELVEMGATACLGVKSWISFQDMQSRGEFC